VTFNDIKVHTDSPFSIVRLVLFYNEAIWTTVASDDGSTIAAISITLNIESFHFKRIEKV
jgi:hypothetical protein